MTPDEMRAYVEAAPPLAEAEDYETAGTATAKVMLAYFTEHPDEADVDYWHLPDDLDAQIQGYGLTGFMVGWALNAVKYILGRPPVANPAIVTISTEDQPE